MTTPTRSPAAPDDAGTPAPEHGVDNRGVPSHVLPSGEVRGSGAGAGGGGAPEDPDTDDPTMATPEPDAPRPHPEHHGDGTNYGSA